MYTRDEILKLLKPSPAWSGFEDWVYEKKTKTLKECLHEIYTAWDWVEDYERLTFIESAKMIINNAQAKMPNEKLKKIYKIKNGYNDKLVQVPVFYHKDLKIGWPDEYPANATMPDNAYVAEDRNHRLTAYALKFLEDASIGEIPTEIYYGKKKK